MESENIEKEIKKEKFLNSPKIRYLGLLIQDEFNVFEVMKIGLMMICDNYNNLKEIKNITESLNSENKINIESMKTPSKNNEWHVTTLFKKTKQFIKSHPAFINFEEGKTIKLVIKGLVYIENKILIAIVQTETPVENKMPHITLLVGGFSPKHSNDVFEKLFLGGPMEQEYISLMNKEIKFENEIGNCYCITTTLFKENFTNYIIFFKDPITIESTMHVFGS